MEGWTQLEIVKQRQDGTSLQRLKGRWGEDWWKQILKAWGEGAISKPQAEQRKLYCFVRVMGKRRDDCAYETVWI